jgi:hypothetical protein
MKLVLVEKGTVEGYTAAWVAKRMLKTDCEVMFFGNGDRLPDARNKDLLIFGLSFSRNVVTNLAKQAKGEAATFRLFDNDFKGRQELSGIKEVKINEKQTAARMAWEYLRADFRVKIGIKKNYEFHIQSTPWIVDYSEKPKLWKWPAFGNYFVKLAIDHCYKQELEDWDELATRDLGAVFEQGKEFAKKQEEGRNKFAPQGLDGNSEINSIEEGVPLLTKKEEGDELSGGERKKDTEVQGEGAGGEQEKDLRVDGSASGKSESGEQVPSHVSRRGGRKHKASVRHERVSQR